MPIFKLGRAIPVKSRVKVRFRLVEPFKSYLSNNNNKIHKVAQNNILRKFLSMLIKRLRGLRGWGRGRSEVGTDEEAAALAVMTVQWRFRSKKRGISIKREINRNIPVIPPSIWKWNSEINYYYPHMRVGKGFTLFSLSVCLCVCIVITFELLDLLT